MWQYLWLIYLKTKCWDKGNVYDILRDAAKFRSRKTLPAFLPTNIIYYLFLKRVLKDPEGIVDSFNLHCPSYIRIYFYRLSIDL